MNDGYAKFQNDQGVVEIGIGVKEFKCAGETPPQDHPHIYLSMGDDDSILCPYCATKYVYRGHLGRYETDPPGSFFADEIKKKENQQVIEREE
jgi:uncharacterized Zn-finger protein